MRKKLLSMLLCAAMVGTMVTGCGSDAGDSNDNKSSDSDKKTENTSTETIALTLWGAEEDQDFLKDVVSKFEAAYSDQKFDIQIGVESESTAKDTVLKDIEAAADVYSFASDQLADLVRAGALTCIDDVGEALSKGGKTLDDVKAEHADGAIDAASVDGKMYAFPTSQGNSYIMFYDSSVVSAEQAENWDTLLAAAGKAGKKVGMTFNSGWYNASFFYGAGFTTGLNADGTSTMDWNGTSSSGYKGTDVVKAMLDITSDTAFKPIPDGKISDNIKSGDYCAVVSGTWDVGVAQDTWGDGYAAIKLPTFTIGSDKVQMHPAYGYKLEAVNAYSKNAGWATLLAEYISNEESQAAHFASAVQIPTNKKALEDPSIDENAAVTAILSEAEFGVVQEVGGKFWDPAKTFGEMIAKGTLKAKDDKKIQEALDNLVSGVTAPLG